MPRLLTTANVNISQVDVLKVLADLMFEVLGINLRVRLGFWVKLKLPVSIKMGTSERNDSHHDAGAQSACWDALSVVRLDVPTGRAKREVLHVTCSPLEITFTATRIWPFQSPSKTSPKYPAPSFLQSVNSSLGLSQSSQWGEDSVFCWGNRKGDGDGRRDTWVTPLVFCLQGGFALNPTIGALFIFKFRDTSSIVISECLA